MTPQQFIHKWQASKLSERSACHEHFLDLCRLLGQPTPAESDPEGAWYTFERGVHKLEGDQGWADVWMQDHFAWEYKGKHKDLVAAYKQLLQYREDLDNPPLLVVCDMNRFEVHTNFTRTAKKVYAFDLAGLAEPANLEVLRHVFTDPDALRPGQTTEDVTAQVAEIIGQVADGMRIRGIEAHRAAHFLMKIMFSMFAEDIVLLRNKPLKQIFATVSKPGVVNAASKLSQLLKNLFEAMAAGGTFGADDVLHFNGGLFADADVIDLRIEEIQKLSEANIPNWGNVEPSVFGTLFERILDPAKRSQIGAHYTSREDILTLLEPVMMQPLRREWDEVKAKCEALVPKIREESREKSAGTKRKKAPLYVKIGGVSKKGTKSLQKFRRLIEGFLGRLTKVTVLDPACGSGNFLYVALRLLLDLEKEVITYASRLLPGMFPEIRPTQLAGIEINEYAQELASVVIWIGYLQWMYHNGFNPKSNPVLEPIESIRRMDAIVDLSDPRLPKEPKWPAADFIVGNPPFLGSTLFREKGINDEYTAALNGIYALPGTSNVCCYWFERSRRILASNPGCRIGLLATQAIRKGGSRSVLDAIRKSAQVFFAVSDRQWMLDGASVGVSMIGFTAEPQSVVILDGKSVPTINSDLTSGFDIARAKALQGNTGRCFEGNQKGGAFDPPEEMAIAWLNSPNPNHRPTSDVLFPRVNANGLVKKRELYGWIIDFGVSCDLGTAASYESAFEYLSKHVQAGRQSHHEILRRRNWWIHKRTRPEMRAAIMPLNRFVVTSRVGKYRLFMWLKSPVIADSRLFVFAFEDDYTFGVLHSRIHELWSLRAGARHGDGAEGGRPTYNNKVCFETFPFPEPTDAQRTAIADAARELDQLRSAWLNPPEWTTTEILEFPGTVGGPWNRYIDPATIRPINSSAPLSPPGRGAGGEGHEVGTRFNHPSLTLPLKGRGPEVTELKIGTVKYPRTIPRDEQCAKDLKKRTLTNLYNQRPAWLDNIHRQLDDAVFAAYGWSPTMTDDELLAALLELNLRRAAEPSTD